MKSGHNRKPLGKLVSKRIWFWQVEQYVREGWEITYYKPETNRFPKLRPVAWQYEVTPEIMRTVASNMGLAAQ